MISKKLLQISTIFLALAVISVCWAGDLEDAGLAYKNREYSLALKKWLPYAEHGNKNIQYIIGAMYSRGQGVQVDDFESNKWYKLAAEQGLADAQYYYGANLQLGRGVAQNYEESVKWLLLAAKQNNSKAEFSLGFAYYAGNGVEANDKTAVKWYFLSAAKGNAPAMRSLGSHYRLGLGVIQDSVKAHMWYNLAASQGDAVASDERTDISIKMTPQQIAEAQKLARDCQARNFKDCD
jgi:TPR repeat protein